MARLTRIPNGDGAKLQPVLGARNLHTEMNKMISNFMRDLVPSRFETEAQNNSWMPSVNVWETDKEYKVECELPGLRERDIEITFQDNTLFLRGERKMDAEDEDDNYHYVESSYGAFQRSIPFSTKVDEAQISALFKNGLLTVHLSKSEEVVKKTRKITIGH